MTYSFLQNFFGRRFCPESRLTSRSGFRHTASAVILLAWPQTLEIASTESRAACYSIFGRSIKRKFAASDATQAKHYALYAPRPE